MTVVNRKRFHHKPLRAFSLGYTPDLTEQKMKNGERESVNLYIERVFIWAEISERVSVHHMRTLVYIYICVCVCV